MDKQEYIVRKIIRETIKEMNLFHGTMADFDEFDVAYMSTGWGQQAYGYGFYLSDKPWAARAYAKGGYIYTVEVPKGPYLSYQGISKAEAFQIARNFYKYYTEEDEYGKEAYAGHEREFWDNECRYLCLADNGGEIYGTLASIIGSDKLTSEFLYKEGYKGIKWVDKKNTNYVIFNPKDLKILKKDKL